MKKETYLNFFLQKYKMKILHPCWPSQTLTFLSWPNRVQVVTHHEFGHLCKKESNMFVLVKMLDFWKISPISWLQAALVFCIYATMRCRYCQCKKSGHILRVKFYLWTTANSVGGNQQSQALLTYTFVKRLWSWSNYTSMALFMSWRTFSYFSIEHFTSEVAFLSCRQAAGSQILTHGF